MRMARRVVERLWVVPVVCVAAALLARYRLSRGDAEEEAAGAIDLAHRLLWLAEAKPGFAPSFTPSVTHSLAETLLFLVLLGAQLASLGLVATFKRFWPLYPSVPLAILTTLALLSVGVNVPSSPLVTQGLLSTLVFGSCALLALASAAACIAFLVPGLPGSNGRFSVSRRYFEFTSDKDVTTSGCIFYPSSNPVGGSRYAPLAEQNARAFIAFGAPSFIKRFFFFLLDHWVYETAPASDDQSLARTPGHLPVVIFSHGNGANSIMYSATLINLASHGYVCVALDHMDGSACVLRRRRQGLTFYNPDIYRAPTDEEYKQQRRRQLEARYAEMEAAVDFVHHLNKDDLVFRSQLDLSRLLLAGHSFGGATALTTALRWQNDHRRPLAVMVFDPAVDWMPEAERMALLSAATGDALLPPTLMLYSSEWRDKGWGYYHHMSMTFGGKDGASQRPHPRHHVATLPLSTHVTFCDAVFMVPLWIGRTLGHVDRKGDPYFLFAAQDTMLSTWLSHFHR